MLKQYTDNLPPLTLTSMPRVFYTLVAAVFVCCLSLQQHQGSVSSPLPEWMSQDTELNNRYTFIESPLGLQLHRDTPGQNSTEQNQSPSQSAVAVNGPQTLPVIQHHPLSDTLDPVAPGSSHGRSQQVRAPPML
jgi:hypothetical protein